VAVVEDAPNLMACWMKLACLDQAAPKRWMDAYLAALAITGGWRLLTLDRDFLSFENDGLDLQLLEVENSLDKLARIKHHLAHQNVRDTRKPPSHGEPPAPSGPAAGPD
jgi:hypothetical protein